MILKDKNLYYVGGVVRDELLGVKNIDVDLCYEGDAITFAQKNNLLIKKINPDFGTVNVEYKGNFIDIASTRNEIYPRKGHLPKVQKIGCSLKEDLIRRDFTINAMAKRTTDNEIIDYFDGKKDLDKKLLRVLHKNSFIDDPTRIIRGLKFSVRFNFKLDSETKKLQEEYLNNVNYDMSFFRLKKELVDAFNLNKRKVLEIFIKDNMYKLLGENQCIPNTIPEKIEERIIETKTNHIWLIYLGIFDLSNLELTRAEKRIIEWFYRLKEEKPSNNTPIESIIMDEIWRRNND